MCRSPCFGGRQPQTEDTVLAKLEWYKMGGEISDRQWNDILGILKVQENSLDLAYLRHWAPSLGIADLLAHALTDAGMSDEAPPPSPAL